MEEIMAAQARLINPKTIAQLVMVLVVVSLMPMFISGAWNWWGAWACALLSFLGFMISRGGRLAAYFRRLVLDNKRILSPAWQKT
jgi:cytochrome c-type biogenesis protein CcmH/NrfG